MSTRRRRTRAEVQQLVPWPCNFVGKLLASLFASKAPLDRDSVAIHAAAPGPSLFPQRSSIPNPALAQALPGEQTDDDLRLVQPAVMLGGVVHGESIPQPVAGLSTKTLDYGLARVRTQIVQHQMDGIGLRINRSDVQQVIGKLGRGAVVRHLGEMPPRLGRDAAENVSRSAAPIFGIPAGYPSRLHRQRRPDFRMPHHRFLVDTHHRRADSGFSYTANTSSMRAMYSSSSSATHHIFSPPRFQVVAFQQDSDRLSSHPRHQLALHCFLLASAPSSAPVPLTVDCIPEPRYSAAAGHPTALLSPAAPPRTRPAPARPADSVGCLLTDTRAVIGWLESNAECLTSKDDPLMPWVDGPARGLES